MDCSAGDRKRSVDLPISFANCPQHRGRVAGINLNLGQIPDRVTDIYITIAVAYFPGAGGLPSWAIAMFPSCRAPVNARQVGLSAMSGHRCGRGRASGVILASGWRGHWPVMSLGVRNLSRMTVPWRDRFTSNLPLLGIEGVIVRKLQNVRRPWG